LTTRHTPPSPTSTATLVTGHLAPTLWAQPEQASRLPHLPHPHSCPRPHHLCAPPPASCPQLMAGWKEGGVPQASDPNISLRPLPCFIPPLLQHSPRIPTCDYLEPPNMCCSHYSLPLLHSTTLYTPHTVLRDGIMVQEVAGGDHLPHALFSGNLRPTCAIPSAPGNTPSVIDRDCKQAYKPLTARLTFCGRRHGTKDGVLGHVGIAGGGGRPQRLPPLHLSTRYARYARGNLLLCALAPVA